MTCWHCLVSADLYASCIPCSSTLYPAAVLMYITFCVQGYLSLEVPLFLPIHLKLCGLEWKKMIKRLDSLGTNIITGFRLIKSSPYCNLEQKFFSFELFQISIEWEKRKVEKIGIGSTGAFFWSLSVCIYLFPLVDSLKCAIPILKFSTSLFFPLFFSPTFFIILLFFSYFSYFFSILLECGLKGELVKISMDPGSGNVLRDESSLPVVQVLYDFKPNDVAVDPVLLYYK